MKVYAIRCMSCSGLTYNATIRHCPICSHTKVKIVKKPAYVIKDWAGNVLLNGMTFDSFESAWDHILGELTDKLALTEEDYQEYEVQLVKNLRQSQYLEPNDIRNGVVND